MEAERYITVVPAFDVQAPGRDYQGIYSLIGPDWCDFPPDPVGMVPVQIHVPQWGWSYGIVEDAWRSYWQYTFGVPPDERDYWRPNYAGANLELYRVYEEWLESLFREVRVNAEDEELMGQEIVDQLYWSSLIPRRVVETSCGVCAPAGSWTLCSSMLMWHLDGGGRVKRWNPMLPSGAVRTQAERSHRGSEDEFMEACEKVWQEHRAGLSDDDPEKQFETLYDLSGSDEYSATAHDLEGDIANEMIEEVQREHVRLWNPPQWVMQTIDEQLRLKLDWVHKQYGGNDRRMFNILGSPLEMWRDAIDAEVTARMVHG